MRINYNVSAMLSNNALSDNDNLLSKSLERLSSGLKINHAKDNPAGLAMAKRMNAQIEGLSTASQNSSDGVSIIETADGALTEVAEMLQRINELAVKASNGTMGDSDRSAIQDEIKQLKEELKRVSETTEFNGQKLLNGQFELKGYTNVEGIHVNSYGDSVPVRTYTIDSLIIEDILDANGNPTGYKTVDLENLDANGVPNGIKLGENFPNGIKSFEMKDNMLTIRGESGFEMTLDLTDAKADTYTPVTIDVTGIGSMRLQVGANEGQVMELTIPAVNLRNMGIENIDLSTAEGAQDAIARADDAISYVNSVRSRLGAYQNRLESSINSQDITSQNMTSAYSRIMDVDMAEEMTNFTTYQVLTQAGTSMLAQANERPSQVLQLLQ